MAIWKDLYSNGEPVWHKFQGNSSAATCAYFVQYDATSLTTTSVKIRFAFCFVKGASSTVTSAKVSTFTYNAGASNAADKKSVSVSYTSQQAASGNYPEVFTDTVSNSWYWANVKIGSGSYTGNLIYYASNPITLHKEASDDYFCIKASAAIVELLDQNKDTVYTVHAKLANNWSNSGTKDVDVDKSNFTLIEPVKISDCKVTYEDSWLQEGRLWKYDRFFEFTGKICAGPVYNNSTNISEGTKIADGDTLTLIDGRMPCTCKCKIEYTDSDGASASTNIDISNLVIWPTGAIYTLDKTLTDKLGKPAYRVTIYFRGQLDLDDIDLSILMAKPTITMIATVKGQLDSVYRTNSSASTKYEETLVLAPKKLQDNSENKKDWTITITKESSKRFKCSWPTAEYALASQNDDKDNQPTIGYCIELLRCPKENLNDDPKVFTLITGLSTEEDNQGRIWLKRDTTEEDIVIPEGVEQTFVGPGASTQVFVHNIKDDTEDTVEVYFNPKDLIKSFGGNIKDEYEFRIYPYIVASSYLEECEDGTVCVYPGTLLANDCTNSNTVNGLTGVMRVKVGENTWKEGQVWVYTEGGWKEASCVYVNVDGTAKGWKESI